MRFVRCGELLRELKAAKSQDDGQTRYDKLFKMYSEIHYLIIDDLDWGTDADIRMLDDLICTREANHLMLLVTTNRSLSDIEEALPRVLSRFRDKRFARLIYNRAGDYRKRGAKVKGEPGRDEQ
ncbi:MAG: hypothetical protein DDT29_02560 [Dehalococcoidia bacterium]|nr:hypothetical protein [Bacillota bacterium]